MPVLEKTLEKRCRKYAKKQGWLLRKMNGLGFRSWCDRLLIPPAKRRSTRLQFTRPVIWVEFKRKKKTPTPAQQHHHRDLRQRGQHVHVVDDFDDFVRLLEKHP